MQRELQNALLQQNSFCCEKELLGQLLCRWLTVKDPRLTGTRRPLTPKSCQQSPSRLSYRWGLGEERGLWGGMGGPKQRTAPHGMRGASPYGQSKDASERGRYMKVVRHVCISGLCMCRPLLWPRCSNEDARRSPLLRNLMPNSEGR
jgi:hypothetical protein